MRELKLGVLISGRGSNLQALIEACEGANYPAQIVLVLSNERLAQGLDRAEKAGIPTAVIDHLAFEDRVEFDAQIDETLKAHGVELVCLAGFMRLFVAI